MFIRRSNEDFLLQLIDFQQLSKFRNTLNLYPKIQIHQQLLPAVRSKFTKPLFIADTSQTKFFLGEWVELWDLRESRTIKKGFGIGIPVFVPLSNFEAKFLLLLTVITKATSEDLRRRHLSKLLEHPFREKNSQSHISILQNQHWQSRRRAERLANQPM